MKRITEISLNILAVLLIVGFVALVIGAIVNKAYWHFPTLLLLIWFFGDMVMDSTDEKEDDTNPKTEE